LSSTDGIEFHDINLVRTLVEGAIELDPDTRQWVIKENGITKKNASLEPMSLSDYFKTFAAQRPFLVKGTAKGGVGSSENQRSVIGGVGVVRTKADVKTVKDKSEYLNKFGLAAWEDLPLK
jgi:hypothetical protein